MGKSDLKIVKETDTYADHLELAKTPAELRGYFVNQAKPILDEYIGSALGTSELKSNNSDARQETWKLLRDIILGAGNLQKIEAGSTAEVVNMLSDGRITFQEAKELMNMLSTKSEIDDLKVLLEKMDDLNVNG